MQVLGVALSVTNLPAANSLLTDTEKFFFDLRGFIIIRGAVAADDVAAMAAVAKHWVHCDEAEIELEAFEKKKLAAELGDILFDTLMAISMAERDQGIKPRDVYQSVQQKLERRCPYIFVEGAEEAHTTEAAQRSWQKGKAVEKKKDGALLNAQRRQRQRALLFVAFSSSVYCALCC